MNEAVIKQIAFAGLRAPSGANLQNLTFRWDGDTLEFAPDAAVWRSSTDPDDVMAVFGCGMVFENMHICSRTLGWEAKSSLVVASEKPLRPRVAVTFTPCSPAADPLGAAVAIRCTDRRAYEGGSLSDPIFADLKALQNDHAPLEVRFSDQLSDELVDVVSHNLHLIPRDMAWRSVRFTKRSVQRTRTGMPWRALQQPLWKLLAAAVLLRFKPMHSLVLGTFPRQPRPIAPAAREHRNWSAKLASGAALGCIVAPRPLDYERLFAAGRLAEACWLRLCSGGYGFQPMGGMMALAVAELGSPIPGCRPWFEERCRDVFSSAFGLTDAQVPCWVFRTGRSSPLPEDMRTLRRDIDDLLVIDHAS